MSGLKVFIEIQADSPSQSAGQSVFWFAHLCLLLIQFRHSPWLAVEVSQAESPFKASPSALAVG